MMLQPGSEPRGPDSQAESDARTVSTHLSRRFGFALEGVSGRNASGGFLKFRPAGVDPNEGFVIQTQLGWRSLEVSFSLETFSGPILHGMATAEEAKRQAVIDIAARAGLDSGVTRLRINDSEQSTVTTDSWPKTWTSFSLSIMRSPLDWAEVGPARLAEILKWTGVLLSMVVLLLPLRADDDGAAMDDDILGLPEGARTQVVVNRYERSRVNRAVCLQLKGTSCCVCGINFEDVYGDIGRDFIHVHHIVPVAVMGEGYRVNPLRDLVPICPNCHSMAHRKSPPFSPEELSRMVRRRRNHAPPSG
jgi:5-methylcytosine-specific restriction protein A